MKPELEYIKKVVENVTEETLDTLSRHKPTVYARFIYFRLAKDNTKYSLKTIGEAINRTHATVINGLTNFDRDILHDIRWKEKYFTCQQIIGNGDLVGLPTSAKTLMAYVHEMINLRVENELLKKEMQITPDSPEGKLIYYFRNLPAADQGNALFKIETMYKIRENDKNRYRTA